MVINLRKAMLGLGGILFLAIIAYVLATWLTGGAEATVPQGPSRPVVADKPPQTKSPRGFFSEYRLERERNRAGQIELLREMVNNPNVDKKSREAASLRLVELSEVMDREVKTETLVKARGYEDCVVVIQPAVTTVVIAFKAPALPLNQEENLKQQVARIVGCQPDEVCIITHKQNG